MPNGDLMNIKLTNVFHVPDMFINLLSTEALRSKGCFYRNDEQALFIKDRVIASVYVHNGLPHVRLANDDGAQLAMDTDEAPCLDTALPLSYTIAESKASSNAWHKRFSHILKDALHQAINKCHGI